MAPTAITTTSSRRAIALLAACGALWSTAGVLIKFVDWNPGAIWSVRCAIAAFALYAIRRPSLRGISRGEWIAACSLATTTGLFILANKLTTPANAILIQYSAPVWVALFGAVYLGERATRLDWITIVIVIGGIALFFFDQLAFDHALGNIVALTSGVTFAVGTLAIRSVATTTADPLRPLLVGNIIGAVVGAPWIFTSAGPDATGWAALIALGLFQQAAAYLCFAAAIRHASALEAILVPAIEPILSPIWVAFAFGLVPGPWALAGGLVVVGAVTLRTLLARSVA